MTKTNTAALLWTAILATSAIFGSYFFACVFPFAALATIAALTLDRKSGIALVGSVWGVNQIVGFGFRDYPHTIDTVVWGVAIGIAAFAGLFAARHILREDRNILSLRAVGAFAGAFVAYEAVLFAWAMVAGGVETFSPSIVATIALNDASWFAGLGVAHLALSRAMPRLFGASAIQAAT